MSSTHAAVCSQHAFQPYRLVVLQHLGGVFACKQHVGVSSNECNRQCGAYISVPVWTLVVPPLIGTSVGINVTTCSRRNYAC